LFFEKKPFTQKAPNPSSPPPAHKIYKMMRIKEAIQRRKLIQQLNDEYLASQIDIEQHPHASREGGGERGAKGALHSMYLLSY
jgi:hypothetical protein